MKRTAINFAKSHRRLFGVAVIASLIGFAACSNSSKSKLNDNSVPNPKPSDTTTVDSQLMRYKGQTEFANVAAIRGIAARAATTDESPTLGSGAQRAVQESDIFKVGKPGSKLLFTLNDYRGLQVVSFANGAEKPELVGRVKATGNYPSDMYFDEANERLIVLERNWFDQQSSQWGRSIASRLVIYDVKNPSAPHIASTVDVEGEIADSRLVGDVLYVASTIWPDWSVASSTHNYKGKGAVAAFKLTSNGVELVNKRELALPVSGRENMNIVEVKNADAYSYYLIAVLSESGWGWWDRESAVEVVDISSPKGAIVPVMQVSAKGLIQERSSTFIRNNTLIVASNYSGPVGANNRAIRRVAVETFAFPQVDSSGVKLNTISEDEANFRKLYIDRELKKLPANADREAALARLTSDATLGIRGVFVETENKGLKKLLADSTVTTGDSTGLSAAVQDVRVAGDYLYVFWVPSNNIDPLDVFDISAPEKGVKYLKRELFEGWVERSIPISYQNKNFILGLGWIVPTVNDETGRRIPQAVLFEVTKRGATVALDTIAQMNLLNSHVWANFNNQDKFVETKFNADGTGSVMFQIYQWEKESIEGGKLIGFDLNAAIAGNPEKVFTEGGLIQAKGGWLRRVFTNTEIDKVNTLTSTKLGTFDVANAEGHIGAAGDIFKAISILELARNISAYATVAVGDKLIGVQIVDGDSDYSSSSVPATLELRAVNAAAADAELSSILSKTEVTGTYVGHLVLEGRLLVLTSFYHLIPGVSDTGTPDLARNTYETIFTLNLINVDAAGKMTKLSSTSLAQAQPQRRGRGFIGGDVGAWWPGDFSQSNAKKLVKLASGKILLSTGTSIQEVQLSGDSVALAVSSLQTSCIDTQADIGLRFELFNDKPYLAFSRRVVPAEGTTEKFQISKNYIVPVSENNQVLGCGTAVNIPGKVLSTDGKTQLVVEDERLLDVRDNSYEYTDANGVKQTRHYYSPVTARVLVSLALTGDRATLRDMYDPSKNSSSFKALSNGSFISLEKDGEYNPMMFANISLDSDLDFVKSTYLVDQILDRSNGRYASVQIMKVIENQNGKTLAVITEGHRARVLSWSVAEPRPVVKKVQALAADLTKLPASDSFLVNGWYWYGSSDQSVDFSAQLNSLTLIEGLHGLNQVYLVD